MGKVRQFEDLEIFQNARSLNKKIYQITENGDFHKDSRFVQQIHAASGSIMDNIAEGFGRESPNEFKRFLSIARGSLYEMKTQLQLADSLGYLRLDTASWLLVDEVGKLINGLSKSLAKS